jgi:hypothetical protein
LYECETSSLTSREEEILRIFGNRMLRKIFEPTRDEVTGARRKWQIKGTRLWVGKLSRGGDEQSRQHFG